MFDHDRTALLETAAILDENLPAGSLDGVRATLEYLYHRQSEITPDVLRLNAPCSLSRRQAENIVYQLRVEDILTNDACDVGVLRFVFRAAALLAQQEAPPENGVVATIPYDDPALDNSMFRSLLSDTIDLIQSAEDNLVLISPFLSEGAYDRLRPALRTAAGNGATITLITRYLTYGDEYANVEFNREFADALALDDELSEVAFYEYVDDDAWTTFHAKIVVADRHQAYLGTANLTHKGLEDNLELGVIFRDETVNDLADLVGALRTSRFLHTVERVDGETFHRV